MQASLSSEINRRRMLQAAGGLAATGSVAGSSAHAESFPRAANSQMRVMALDKPKVCVAAIQSCSGKVISDNLTAMLSAIDRIQAQEEKKDLISFSVLALQGIRPRGLDEARRIAVSLDGPEVFALSAKAKQHRVYLSFSALTTDRAWPNEVITHNVLLGPDGNIVLAAWQATHDPAMPFLLSVERVIDRYVALYGREAVLPLVNTPIGNIALASDQAAPEIYRALALQGAEVIIRASRDVQAPWDVQACSAYNQCYTVAIAPSGALHAESDEDLSALGGGGSLIVGPRGETLAEASSKWEQTVSAQVPLAYYRQARRKPDVHAALVLPVYAQYQNYV